ncbi:TetR/AcrR family transcriptional regulator [Rhodococcoides yunnanense]|uniref:TetR/AcrR family transcriptional regulator n=1 Tax=Rhodococcoides yunnanense TaxID=278209 RepID=A0ABU4B6L8_9NOCA|nr:TetR/AcrR family transcriptional regulator [Rhodococcus yunnanensis]MDV6259833.1 TetR/AcrR family transcriptional regulator [Rhodococcus yunnanensis]
MGSSKSRLSRSAWVDAAAVALRTVGPAAVSVEPLARSLGATKGSFYWHFSNRDELLRAALEAWESADTVGIIAAIDDSASSSMDKVRRLIAIVLGTGTGRGELEMLFGADHPEVKAVVGRVTKARIGYIEKLLGDSGFSPAIAKRRALLAYSVYLGQAQLEFGAPEVLPKTAASRRALENEFMDILIGS